MTSNHSIVERCSFAPNNFRVVSATGLDRSRLSRIVDVNDSKSLRVAVSPLEVIEQRPDEIPAYINTALNRVAYSSDMSAEILDSLRIVDLSIDRRRRIRKSRSILRDVEWDLTVPLL